MNEEKIKKNQIKPNIMQCLFAELFGTFLLTFVDSSVGIIDKHGEGVGGILGRSLAPMAVIVAMIFCIGEISGAHMNPAVTIGFTLRKDFPWKKVPLYLGAQILGALIAGFLVLQIFGSQIHFGLTIPSEGIALAAAIEILISWFLVSVVLNSSSEANVKGWESAFPVGATLLFCGLIGKTISGASMNPARSIGTAVAAGDLKNIWIYILCPLVGAGLGVLTVFLIQGRPCAKELKAAQGE